MMQQFRTRLTLLFIVLIGAAVLAAGIFMAIMVERSKVDSLQSSMKREIEMLLATVVSAKHDSQAFSRMSPSEFAQLAIELRKSAGARVTFVAADGQVLGDSDSNPAEMNNHSDREEIREARESGVGYSQRHSDTTNRTMLYVALPIQEDGKLFGFARLSMTLDEVETTIDTLWWGLLGGLLIVFLIAGGISYRIAYQLTRPLEKMTRVARQITNMNYRSRVHIRNTDEIGQLGQAINTMADSLQVQMNRIRENETRLSSVLDNMVSGVVMIDEEGTVVLLNRSAEDIVGYAAKELIGKRFDAAKLPYELAQMIQECMDRNEHIRDELVFYYPEERILEVNLAPMVPAEHEWAGLVIVLHDISAIRRLEKVRSEFVANVSHELKTPVAAVKGFAETLLAGAMSDPAIAKQFLQIIYDESERLNRLIGDILELSKIESKRVPLQFSPVHLNSFLLKILEMLQPEADKKSIGLTLEVSNELYLEADEDRLGQIIINLLSNGINYTPEGGKVKVKATPVEGSDHDQERIRIEIADTGIGIPKKDLPRIFERFYRVDKARSRSSGGTGLGLSIVKHLVELHYGVIRVDSDLGSGSKFTIELPVLHS